MRRPVEIAGLCGGVFVVPRRGSPGMRILGALRLMWWRDKHWSTFRQRTATWLHHLSSGSARPRSRARRGLRARVSAGRLQSGSQDRAAPAAPGPHRHRRKGRGRRFGGADRRYPGRERGQSRLPDRRADHRAQGRGRRQGRAGPGAGETRSAGRTQRAPLGAGGARRRAGPGGRSAGQFRPSEPPDGKGLHDPGDFRCGEPGAADGAGPGRRRVPRNSTSPRTG